MTDSLSKYIRIDAVVCIDAMWTRAVYLKQAKAKAREIYRKFAEAAKSYGRSFTKFRVKVIAFGDFAAVGNSMAETEFFELPEREEEFAEIVGSIDPRGGGNSPSNALEALTLALKSEWSDDTDDCRQVIMLFTDAPALHLDERSEYEGYPDGMPFNLEELRQWWEGERRFDHKGYRKDKARLLLFAPVAYPWEEVASWSRCFMAANKNAGISDIDFETAVRLVFCDYSE